MILQQLLAGRDFAKGDRFAGQMANFIYLIGDEATRECMVVDPAWDVTGILEVVDSQDLRLTGALATHYHPDHIGGDLFGYAISGLAELQSLRPVKVYVNELEAGGIRQVTGLAESDLINVKGGDEVRIGSTRVRFLHTPGHTPGSQCFQVDGSLVSGDTLFIGGCGRVDLPGGDADQMYYSLTQVLGKLPDTTKVYPGHNYGQRADSTIGREKLENIYMRISTLSEWHRLMG